MFVMRKGFQGDMTAQPPTTQAWHNRIVTSLLNSAKGDLMLDSYGNLTERFSWSNDSFAHSPGETMALIGSDGWLLTSAGAQWVLKNCPPDSRRDVRLLEVVATRPRADTIASDKPLGPCVTGSAA